MSKTLVLLIILGIFLLWKFVLFPEKLDFTDRVKVLQGLSLVAPYKAAVAEYYETNKVFPGVDQTKMLEEKVKVDLSKSIVASVKIGESAPGSITVYYTNARDQALDARIAGKQLTLRPLHYNGKLDWSCKGNVPEEFVPAACR